MPIVTEISNNVEVIAVIIGALSGGVISLVINSFKSHIEDKRALKNILFQLCGFYRNVIALNIAYGLYMGIRDEIYETYEINYDGSNTIKNRYERIEISKKIEFLADMLTPVMLFDEFDEIVKVLSKINPKIALRFAKERYRIVSLRELKQMMIDRLNSEVSLQISLKSMKIKGVRSSNETDIKFHRGIQKLEILIPIIEQFLYDIAKEIDILEYHYITDEVRMTEDQIEKEYKSWCENIEYTI